MSVSVIDGEVVTIAEFKAAMDAILINKCVAAAILDAEKRDMNSDPDIMPLWPELRLKKPVLPFLQATKAKLDGMTLAAEDKAVIYFSLGKIHGMLIMLAQKEGATLESLLARDC
jgi:hypothetical protein